MFIQACARDGRGGWRRLLVSGGILAALAGCANRHETGPEAWWHQAIGGKIAEQRPAPPGDTDPYPRLGSIPAKPPAPDQQALNRLTAGLVADRTAANEAAASAPIPPVGSRPPPPPALNNGGVSASLAAAAAPRPQPPSGQSPSGQSPFGQPAPAVPQRTAPPPAANTPVAVARPGAAPPIPPPLPPGVTALDFTLGSSTLSGTTLDRIRDVAVRRGDRPLVITVTGYGEAIASDAAAQGRALELGFSRARAIATALAAQGVPASVIRVNAEAAGRGAGLRLLQ